MTSTTAFISELIRAANEIDRLTKDERARLLERAANTLRDLREIAQLPQEQATQDAVLELREMARLIDLFSAAEVATTMKGSVALIIVANARAREKVH
jgi:division protein CdvB (Snf7/Vps24/ESCRT-III family)